MTTLLNIADWIFIFVLGLPVLYLFVFALSLIHISEPTRH